MVIELLFAALSLVSPKEGWTVEQLRPAHKEYLDANRRKRFDILDDAKIRNQIYAAGYRPKPLKLEWQGGEDASTVELGIVGGDSHQTFSVTNASHLFVTNLEIGREYFWRVTSGEESVEGRFYTDPHPPRLVLIDGVVNCRDLGGWTGLDGRKVKQNMIIRSAGLRGSAVKKDKSIFSNRYEPGGREVTDFGLDILRNEMKIRTDIEVRGVQETVCMQDSIIGKDVTFVKVPFSAYNFIDNMIRGREPFAKLFRYFIDEKAYPILFHCSGGRDRTGTLSFLLLGLLGLSDEDICRDWEASIFSEQNTEFGSARIGRLLGYMDSLGGRDLASRCVIFAHSCGITDEEIAKFREIMLEK